MAAETAGFAQHATLDADTVDSVTLGANWGHAEVICWTAGRIYFTVNGDDPTVGGDNTYVAGPYGGRRVVPTPSPTPTVVKLRSATADEYSVTGL